MRRASTSHVTHAHAHADNAPLGGPYARKTIAWCPCTPPSTVERFCEKISAEACSGKEIAGLLKKMMMMMMMMMMKNMMTRKSRNCI